MPEQTQLPLLSDPFAPLEPLPAPPAPAETRGWWQGPIAALDFETTGVNPSECRIVTAALIVQLADGSISHRLQLVANPECEIPEEAALVHGYTTERARIEGLPYEWVIRLVGAAVASVAEAGIPLVIFNARFDWTLLQAEAARALHLGKPVVTPYLIDPMIIDRAVDKYRKGGRKLGQVCEHYQVELKDAHDAGADATAAIGLARALANQYRQIRVPLEELQGIQARWFEDWRVGLNQYWAKKGLEQRMEPGWPVAH